MIPLRQQLNAYQGATFSTIITLVSGSPGTTPSVPINLTGFNAIFSAGPWINISSVAPTVSGTIGINGTAGTLALTISGSATANIFSPQSYYLLLQFPNGNTGYLMNGTINFANPYNSVVGSKTPYQIGPDDITISVTDFDDFMPIALPPVIVTTSGFVFGNATNG